MFDDGYEAYREWVLARMVERGVVPEGTELTPLNPMPADVANEADYVRPWAELNDEEKKLFCRMAEVFAGFSEYTDVQVGRIVDFLEKTGQLDNTIIFYCADNGASGEGTPNGSVNENKFFNGYPDSLEENLSYFDELGGPETYNHYPTGWAVAFSTPFQMFKRYAQFAGGTCDPLVVHWPKGIKAKGEMRHQYHHSTDIVPTILEAVGLEMPAVYRGVEQYPLNGVSMRYSFDDAHAPTTKKRQYFSMLGTRGIWQDGWKAAALHAPISGKGHFDQDVWELYHVDEDRAEARNLAGQYPEKLQELIDAWFEEAEANFVLPLDDRPAVEQINDVRPQGEPPRSRYVYYPDTAPVPESTAVNIRGRSYKILADVEVTAGVRGRHLRPRLPVRRAHAVHQGPQAALRLQLPGHQAGADVRLPELEPGQLTLGVEFVREGAGEHMESVGTAKLYVGEQVVAEGPMRAQIGPFTLCGDGLCVGYDSADPVSRSYPAGFPFTGGRILGVAVDVGEDQYLDLEREAAAAFARD